MNSIFHTCTVSVGAYLGISLLAVAYTDYEENQKLRALGKAAVGTLLLTLVGLACYLEEKPLWGFTQHEYTYPASCPVDPYQALKEQCFNIP